MYDDVKNLPVKKHKLSMEGRGRLNIEGVQDVKGFDENLVILKTDMGVLNIRGREMHVENLNLAEGELCMKGYVQELSYEETTDKSGLWHRLFG